MATGLGTADIDFGAAPGSNEAQVDVADAGVAASAKIEAYVMGDDSTSQHSANDHRYVVCFLGLTVGNVVAGVGFTIFGRSLEQLTGMFRCRYVWSD